MLEWNTAEMFDIKKLTYSSWNEKYFVTSTFGCCICICKIFTDVLSGEQPERNEQQEDRCGRRNTKIRYDKSVRY